MNELQKSNQMQMKDALKTYHLYFAVSWIVIFIGLYAFFYQQKEVGCWFYQLLLNLIPGAIIAAAIIIIAHFLINRYGLSIEQQIVKQISELINKKSENIEQQIVKQISELINKKSEKSVEYEQEQKSPSFVGGKFVCRNYFRKDLSIKDISESTKILHKVIARSGWEPDLIFGVNEGGAIMAATSASQLCFDKDCIGAIYTAKKGGNNQLERFVSYIAVPKEIKFLQKETSDSSLKILILDTKLKSGKSAVKAIKAIQEYFKDITELEIAFGFALVYNDDKDIRKDVINSTTNWPKTLTIDSSKNKEGLPFKIEKVYCAYFLDCSFKEVDDVWEELRWPDKS